MRTNEPATYLVEGRHLTEAQCRALFAELPLSDRHIKVLDRIEGDTVVDVGCFTGAFVCEATRRFPRKTITGVDYFEDNIRIARLLYPQIRHCYQQMSVYQLGSRTRRSIASPCRKRSNTWREQRSRSKR